MGTGKQILAAVWAFCGVAMVVMCLWAGSVGGFGAGPLIGIVGGTGIAIWQGRIALGVQQHNDDEEESEWY